jgi:pilus assembly protein CpaE
MTTIYDASLRAGAQGAGVRAVVDSTDHAGVLSAEARSEDLSWQVPAEQSGRPTGRAVVPGQPARLSEPEHPIDRPGQPARPNGPDHPIDPAGGQVITVFATKGGCGTSTIATNLAITLAAQGGTKVCLLDLDLAFGDVAILLQLSPDKTIGDAVPVADRIDETGFRTLLTPYRPGLDVLLAPVQPATAEEITRDLITEVIHLARSCFDFVVIDTTSAFSEQMLAVLDATHHYLLVCTPELPALKDLRVTLDMFELLDYRSDARSIVLNRADAKVGLSMADIERIIRVPITGYVPSSRDVPISANQGVPLAAANPQHPVSVAIRELVTKRFMSATAPAKRGLFARKKR